MDRFTFTGGVQWNNGAGTLKWTDAANWNPSGAPGASTDAFFTSAGLSSGNTVNLNGSQTTHSLAIQGTVNFMLGGSGSLALGSGYLTRSPGASGTQTIAQPVILGANGMWYIAGAGQLVVSGGVSGPYSLTKLSSGTLTLSGTNSYSQGTIVAAGTLIIANPNAILSGSGLTLGGNAVSMFASPVPMMTQPMATLSVSADGKPPVPAFSTAEVVKSFPAAASAMPRIDMSSRSSAAKTIAADLAWLRQASASDDLAQGREKDAALSALDALFADYGR